MCPAFTRHTNSTSRLSYAHTYLPPPLSVVSTQQAEAWHHESHQSQQLCNGRHVGHSSGQAVRWGAVWASLGVEGCHLPSVSFFFTLPISCLCMKEAICLLPVIYGCERVCDTLHFELVCHPPTSFLTHKMKPCWPSLTSPLSPVSLVFNFSCFMALHLQSSPPQRAAVSYRWGCCLLEISYFWCLALLWPWHLLYSVSNLKVVRARLVSSKILCTLSWFIYAINHGTWVNICAICSPASWSTAEQNHIPLFFITEATPVPLSW